MTSHEPLGARAFGRFAWMVLVYAIAVIVWGAVVRATGSGAGCGAHWPLCNGNVVPLAPRTATIIEYAHRATSGLILIFSVTLVAWAYRVFPTGHSVRRAASWSLVFCLLEAAIGAGIVLLRFVEHNASAARAAYLSGHLANTLMLMGALTAAAWAAHPRPAVALPDPARRQWARAFGWALIALMIVSAAGAIVALGDTLFPSSSLANGFAADFDPASSFLIRLRVWHPILAVAASGYALSLIARSDAFDDEGLRAPAMIAAWLIGGQIVLGAINLLALAPLWLQMAHLAVANALWVAMVWMWLQLSAPASGRRSP